MSVISLDVRPSANFRSTNKPLAYTDTELIAGVKSFIVQAQVIPTSENAKLILFSAADDLYFFENIFQQKP